MFTSELENAKKYLYFVLPSNRYPYIDSYSDPFFIPCFIHLAHGGYCTAIVFNGIDSVFITTCFHITAQFQILSLKVRNVLSNAVDRTTIIDARENQRVRKELFECIAKQVAILETNELFVMIFRWIILGHFISVALIIGIGSINLLLV